jgi:hypothetical protein
MRTHSRILSLSLALGLAACSESPVAPTAALSPADPALARPDRGTGISVTNFLGGVPIVQDVRVDQVVITGFAVNALGGLQAVGTITGAKVGAPGVTLTDDFTADVLVSSTGPGQCGVVTVDLSGLNTDVLGLVNADLPVATVGVNGTGPVGSLLCALGSVVNGVAGGVVGGLVNALNGLLGGSVPAPTP